MRRRSNSSPAFSRGHSPRKPSVTPRFVFRIAPLPTYPEHQIALYESLWGYLGHGDGGVRRPSIHGAVFCMVRRSCAVDR